MKIIGIAGRAGSGKDPAAHVLAGHAPGPTVVMPLATGLKAMLAGYYGWSPNDHRLYTSAGKKQYSPRPLNPGNTVRQDLIDLGDATRAINPRIWIDDCLFRAAEHNPAYVLIPDVRYRNELGVVDCGIWMGPDAPGDHPTEAELTSADFGQLFRFKQPSVAERLAMLRSALQVNSLGVFP